MGWSQGGGCNECIKSSWLNTMKNITVKREAIYKLIEEIRDIISKEDLSIYLGDCLKEEKAELEIDLLGVSNGFLSEVIRTITGYEVEVCGEVENLFPCPCCGYKTLTEYFNPKEGTGYEICPYCNWEDDGTTDMNSYRSINKGSILDYRGKIRANPNRYYRDKWLRG